MLQSSIVLSESSEETLAIIVPVLLKETYLDQYPYKFAISVFVSMSQSLIESLYDPLARIAPVLSKETDWTSA